MTTETDYRDAMVEMAGNELERLREREREAAIILATALACGDYKSQHSHWLRSAAEWLTTRTTHV